MNNLIESILIIPKNHPIHLNVKSRFNDFLIMHTKSYIRNFLNTIFSDTMVYNVDYKFCKHYVINNVCGCCGTGENCGRYDYEYLEIGFNLKSDDDTTFIHESEYFTTQCDSYDCTYETIFDKHKNINGNHNIKIFKYQRNKHIIIFDNGICNNIKMSTSNDCKIRKDDFRYYISIKGRYKDIDIVDALVYDWKSFVKFYETFEGGEYKIDQYEISCFSKFKHYIDKLKNAYYDTDISSLIDYQDTLSKKLKHTPIIWIHIVTLILLCANRFDKNSILNVLPVDIMKIIAKRVYSSIDVWFEN